MVDAPSQATTRTGSHYPAHSQDPKWTDNYIKVAVQDLEKMVIPKFANASARNVAIVTPAAGDMCWLNDTKVLQVYKDGAWVQVYPSSGPNITSGTGVPSGGADGDVYFQYPA